MARTVGIGIQNFGKIISENCFYVDKTKFIQEWWESKDEVTLITRPRRFGKTLTMSMIEQFFSVAYAEKNNPFEGLFIWDNDVYQKLKGTYPVISLSFANVKEPNYDMARERIYQLLIELYAKNAFLLDSAILTEEDRKYFRSITTGMSEVTATMAVHKMSDFLFRYYQKNIIILLDEYDTPMQEAYINGYWPELASFTRSLFNAAFKTNPYIERAIMTGITRVGKESIFSDLNNLKVVTTTSEEYADSFGFTKKEVIAALGEYSLSGQLEKVEYWYDGFTFGNSQDIYNPWSIINFLDTGKFSPYWANTSSNSLISKLVRESGRDIKQGFELLMDDKMLETQIDEQIVFTQLDDDESAIWSLLLACGYLKVKEYHTDDSGNMGYKQNYGLVLTNFEVKSMFYHIIRGWFRTVTTDYNDFIKSLLANDIDAMNEYMNRVSLSVFSYFDTGSHQSGQDAPERFYHGFVLGLLVELYEKYHITSNRESGFGRYDIMLEPKEDNLDAIIIEFKVYNPRKEASLEDTVRAALVQIDDQQYAAALTVKGISKERIRKLGFAFKGKEVFIAG